MSYDLGDVVALSVEVRDANAALANATGVTLTVTLPDGTSATPSPTNPTTGSYVATYTPTQVGRHVVRWVATGSNASSYIDTFDVRDTTDAPLVSLTDAKAHLNITATTHDEELRRFLDVATDAAERFTGRTFRGGTVVETLDGDGGPVLLLSSLPVRSITSVSVSGSALATDAYAVTSTGVLTRKLGSYTTGAWDAGTGNVTVTYLAGEASPPAVAVQAVLEMTRHLWQTQRGSMPNRSQAGDDYNPGLGYSMPQRVVELLEPLRIPGAA